MNGSLSGKATPARRAWKVLEVAASAVGVGMFLARSVLWTYYSYTRPTSPDRAIGRVYVLNTHGWVVYLNGHEHFLLIFLVNAGWLLFAGAVVVDLVKKPFRKARP